MKKIALIGASGSIGRQVVNVALRHPDKFSIVAMCANAPSEEFEKLAETVRPEFYAFASQDKEGALSVADYPYADVVFNAAGGFAGLEYSLRAVSAGKNLALANKETMVCGGKFVTEAAKFTGAEIIPVDSEHSALWQCMNFDKYAEIDRLIITASGGALRGKSAEELKKVTPAQALAHPTWKMGAKITIDSATLVNKGYEVIEAHELFGTPYDRITTVIQPQSVIHSLVQFADGCCLAQMSRPTMEIPIQLALSYPQRFATEISPLDFTQSFSLGFEKLSRKEYPLYDLALACGEEGGAMPCVFNAADEVAVKSFLNGEIAFTDVYSAVYGAVDCLAGAKAAGYEELAEIDRAARRAAQKIIEGL